MFQERTYRCLVFDPADRECCGRSIHAFSDRNAIERAVLFLTRFQCGSGVRLELWRGQELLHTEVKSFSPRAGGRAAE